MASRLRRALDQLSGKVTRRMARWPEGSWPDSLQRSPYRVRSTARDVMKTTAQAAMDFGRKAARESLRKVRGNSSK